MKIAILASEGAPYIKAGGLGDVMEALPAALARIPGNEVTLILPYNKKILDESTMTPEKDRSPYNGLISRIWELSYN